MDLVSKAKRVGNCPTDMDAEKWAVDLGNLEKELLEELLKKEKEFQSRLKTIHELLEAGLWLENCQWLLQIETVRGINVSEIEEIDGKDAALRKMQKEQLE